MAVLPVPGFPARRMARPPIYDKYATQHIINEGSVVVFASQA